MASPALRCLKKHMIRCEDMPSRRSPSLSARRKPVITVSRSRSLSVGMGLRVEEDLGVAHALGGGPSEIGPGQVVEVPLVEQYLGALVVEVQEQLQVGEVVSLANLPHRAVPEPYPIASGDLEHHFRLQRAFDVNVQLRLGYLPQELVGERRIS